MPKWKEGKCVGVWFGNFSLSHPVFPQVLDFAGQISLQRINCRSQKFYYQSLTLSEKTHGLCVRTINPLCNVCLSKTLAHISAGRSKNGYRCKLIRFTHDVNMHKRIVKELCYSARLVDVSKWKGCNQPFFTTINSKSLIAKNEFTVFDLG